RTRTRPRPSGSRARATTARNCTAAASTCTADRPCRRARSGLHPTTDACGHAACPAEFQERTVPNEAPVTLFTRDVQGRALVHVWIRRRLEAFFGDVKTLRLHVCGLPVDASKHARSLSMRSAHPVLSKFAA